MGFDNECILNIQSLAGEYFCPVCRQLVYPNEAIQTQCTHLYCKPCLTYIVSTTRACPYDGYLVTEADAKPLIEANKAVAEAIGRVSVHCLYHRSGCTWQGPFSECTTHCTGCAYGNSPVVCNRCGTQIVHRQVQEHAQNCPGTQPLAQQQDSSQAQGSTVESQAAQATNPQQVTPTGTPVASQALPSQNTAPAGQDQNQSNPNVQPQAVAQAVVQPHAQAGQTPTPEQLYQQYQQYYQQYPQYDQHQQHLQQYGQYQQQAHHQFPSHPQVHAQAYPQQVVQAHPQPQPYLQTPAQAQALAQPLHHPQLQMAAHATPQPQMHSQVNPQLQPQHHPQQPQLQMAAHAIPQPQMQAQVNPQLQPQHHPQQPQAQMLCQGQPLAHAQMPGQQLGHPHPEAHHPHPQQQLHAQIPQQQQTQPQIQHHHQPQTHGQPQVQSQLHGQPQVQTQLHAQQQVHPHPYPHTHPQPQPHMQPPLHPQHQPQPHPLQPQIHQQPEAQAQAQSQPQHQPQPQAQPQLQHPPAEASRMAQAVTGQQSYLQARPQPHIQLQQQVAPGAPQQHPMHMHPHQHAVQPQNQYPPSQQQRPVPHQQQMMPPPQGPLQQPLHRQPHQQSQSHHHLGMQQLLPQQQPVTQPHIPPQQQPHSHHLAQPQPRPQHLSGQPPSLVHSQQHQETPFSAQQHMQPSAQSLRPQGQPTLRQHPSQVQPNIPSGRIQHPPGRPIVHNLGTPQQPFPQSSKLLQLPSSDNYLQRSNLHPQMLPQQQSDSTLQSPPPRSGSQTTLLATSAAQRAMENRLVLAEKQGDFEPEKTGEAFALDAKPASHKTNGTEAKTNGTEANDSDNRHIHGVDSAELKVSRSASVSMDGEEKAVVVNEEKNSEHPEFAVTEPSDSSKMIDKGMESKAEDDDTHEPIVKQIVKEDASEKPMEPSPSGTLVEAESKGGDGDSNSFIKHEEKNALMEVKEGHDDKVLPDAQGPQKVQSQVDGSEAGQTFPRRERPIQSILSQGQTQGIERSNIPASQQLLGGSGFDRNPLSQPPHQGFAPPHDRRLMEPAFCDRNLHQVSHQGPGPDEYQNFLPPRQEVGAIPQRNFVQSTHSVPNLDEERYRQQQIQGRGQQRPPVLLPGSNQEMRLPGPPPHFQGQQLLQLRPHGPGSVEKFPQQGPPSIAPDHFQPPPFAKQPGAPHGSFHPEAQPSGLTGMSSSSFPRGPNHLGPPQKGFEAQPIAPQGRLQGQILTPHEGGPNISQGETLPGPPMAAPPPRAFDSAGGIMARGPFYGPEGQMGRPPMPNPMNHGDTNKRSEFFDGKQPELHQPSAFQPNAMKMNGVPGNGLLLEAPFPHVLPGERFKPFPDERFKHFPEESFKLLPEERFKPFPQDPNRRIVDRREFEEDLMRFPRPGHLDGEPKFESYFSSSRPFDRGPNPFGLDAAPKSGGSVGVAPLKAMPPYEPGNLFPTNSGGSSVLPVDIGDRSTPLSLNNDNIERNARPDFLKPFPEFNQHRLDGFPPPRSPSKFGTGIGLGSQSHQLEDFNSREFLAFGEQSKSFNISDSIGNAFKGSQTPLRASESRFPVFPSSTRLGGKFGSSNLHGHSRSGDLGPDILPSHLRSGEPVGPGNFSSHFRGGEMTSTGSLPSHLRIGEQPSVGNLPSRSGEPGFGNSFPTFQGPSENDMDQSRKRNAGSMGWCRICKIDCQTVEGLDLHSQTREHQKMAMDMVLLIKQDNSKKRKLSFEECTTLEDGQKSKKGSFDSR